MLASINNHSNDSSVHEPQGLIFALDLLIDYFLSEAVNEEPTLSEVVEEEHQDQLSLTADPLLT